jgi:hypothetical protein
MEPVTKFTLLGASIREVGSINYNISDGTGQTAEFEVGIAYHFFEEGRPT